MGLMDKFANPELFGTLSFGDKMLGSTITMIMGIGMTFLILCLLWAFIAIMGKCMNRAPKGDKASAQTVAAATPSAAPVAAAPAASNDAEIAAVIAAAIAAYEGSGRAGNLVVRKISRISGETTLWTNAAREDCIESRKF